MQIAKFKALLNASLSKGLQEISHVSYYRSRIIPQHLPQSISDAKCSQSCQSVAIVTYTSIISTSNPDSQAQCSIALQAYRVSNLRSCKAVEGNQQTGSSFWVCKVFGEMPQEVSSGLRPQFSSLSSHLLAIIGCCCSSYHLLSVHTGHEFGLHFKHSIFHIPQVLIHQNLIHGNLEALTNNPLTALSCNSNWPSCQVECASSMHRESSSFMRLLCCIIWRSLFRSRLLAGMLSRGLRTKLSWKEKPCCENWSPVKIEWAVHLVRGEFHSVMGDRKLDTREKALLGSDPRTEEGSNSDLNKKKKNLLSSFCNLLKLESGYEHNIQKLSDNVVSNILCWVVGEKTHEWLTIGKLNWFQPWFSSSPFN